MRVNKPLYSSKKEAIARLRKPEKFHSVAVVAAFFHRSAMNDEDDATNISYRCVF